MQRGAANLHVSEVLTAVTIPKLDTELHQCLGSQAGRLVLSMMPDVLPTGADLKAKFGHFYAKELIPKGYCN